MGLGQYKRPEPGKNTRLGRMVSVPHNKFRWYQGSATTW